MLSCRDISQKASDYLEKDLSFASRVNVKMHLMMCINCRRYMRQLQTTIQTLGKMQTPETETATDQEIKQIVELLKNNNKGS